MGDHGLIKLLDHLMAALGVLGVVFAWLAVHASQITGVIGLLYWIGRGGWWLWKRTRPNPPLEAPENPRQDQ